jgi:hypothetical protein
MTAVVRIAPPRCVAAAHGGRNHTGADEGITGIRGTAAGPISAEARPAVSTIRGGSA